MQATYDTLAPKRAANLSVNENLLKQARALNINLSATLEESLVHKIQSKQQKIWLAENKAAIADYNQLVDEQGVFGDSLRSF